MKITLEMTREVPTGKEDIFYHYTSAEGALGILKEGVLRLGNIYGLNDWAEVTWTQDVALKVLAKLSSEQGISADERRVLEGELKLISVQAFVFSFSTHVDLLSQWRGYADDARGFCLGISSFALPPEQEKPNLIRPHDDKPTLHRVSYDRDKLEQLVRSHLLETLDLIRKNSASNNLRIARDFASKMKSASLIHKNHGFNEEGEYRLIQFPGAALAKTKADPLVRFEPEIKYTQRNGRRSSYREVKIENMRGKKAWLREFWIGPKCLLGEEDAKRLLKAHGQDEAVVKVSEATYR